VNALIRNFRKTDFTSELAQKETDLNSKREEYDSLDAEKLELENRKSELDEQIVNLSQQIVPIQVNLNIADLNDRSEKLKGNIDANKDIMQNKTKNITTITEKMVGLTESINEKKMIGDTDIEEAKTEYDIAITSKKNTGHYIQLLEQAIESNQKKISHLDSHKYDPNCEFCCDNVFVKDAVTAKEDLVKQGNEMETLNIAYDALLNQITLFGDIETQWNEYNDLKNELEKAAERNHNEQKLNTYTPYSFYDAFKEGAKWQAERMYSLEQISKEFIGEEGQSGYFDDWLDYRLDTGNKLSFKEWFEQFKKK
jgi:hypothetical protein